MGCILWRYQALQVNSRFENNKGRTEGKVHQHQTNVRCCVAWAWGGIVVVVVRDRGGTSPHTSRVARTAVWRGHDAGGLSQPWASKHVALAAVMPASRARVTLCSNSGQAFASCFDARRALPSAGSNLGTLPKNGLGFPDGLPINTGIETMPLTRISLAFLHMSLHTPADTRTLRFRFTVTSQNRGENVLSIGRTKLADLAPPDELRQHWFPM